MESNFRFGIIERLTVAAFIAGVAGVVASMTLPPPYQEFLAKTGLGPYLFWVSVVVIALTVVFFVGDMILYFLNKRSAKLGLVMLGTALIIVGGFVGLIGALQVDGERPRTAGAGNNAPQTLEQLFKADFERTLRTSSELTVGSPEDATIADKVLIQIYNDMDTGTYFVGFYVPASPRTADIIGYLADGYLSPTLQLRQGVEITSRDPADTTPLKFSEFNFSRRVYVYYEADLSIQDIAALDTLYRSKNLILQLRGRQYQTTRWLQKSAIKK
jgi:hypothetical protein